MQQIATLLDATCCTRLATLLQRVATCCELKIELVRMPTRNIVVRIWPNDYNIMQHPQMLHGSLTEFEPTAPNMSQQGGQTHATCCTQQCCDMLFEMLRLFGRGFSNRVCIAYHLTLFILGGLFEPPSGKIVITPTPKEL